MVWQRGWHEARRGGGTERESARLKSNGDVPAKSAKYCELACERQTCSLRLCSNRFSSSFFSAFLAFFNSDKDTDTDTNAGRERDSENREQEMKDARIWQFINKNKNRNADRHGEPGAYTGTLKPCVFLLPLSLSLCEFNALFLTV